MAIPENTIILFVCPPKFCISIVFVLSWDHCKSQEKLETMLMQNLGGQTKSIMVFSGVAYGHNFFFWSFRETTRYFSFRSQNSEYPRIFQVARANQNPPKLLFTELIINYCLRTLLTINFSCFTGADRSIKILKTKITTKSWRYINLLLFLASILRHVSNSVSKSLA